MPFGAADEMIEFRLQQPGSSYSPGDFVVGTVIFRTKEPLSIGELRIKFEGECLTHIARRYFIRGIFAFWEGHGYLFRKYIILQDGPHTLSPGEYAYNFAFQLPFTSEFSKGKGMRGWFWNWPERAPFPGKTSAPHPLPPTSQVSANQSLGECSGSVSYTLSVATKKGPQSKFLAWNAINNMTINVITPRMVPQVDSTLTQYSNVHKASGADFRLIVSTPREVVQNSGLSMLFSIEGSVEPVSIESLEVLISAIFKVRGRNILWGFKVTRAPSSWRIVAWEGQNILLGPNPVNLTPRTLGPPEVPPTFATYAIACIGHSLDIRYNLRTASGKKIDGKIKNIPLVLHGWKTPPDPSKQSVPDLRNWFDGRVMEKEQYAEHVQARKKAMKN